MSADDYFGDDTDKRKTGDLEAFWYLSSYALPWWKGFLFSILAVVTSAASAMIAAYYLGQFVELGLKARDAEAILNFAIYVFLLEFLSVVLMYAGRRGLATYSSYAILSIRRTLFQHMHELPMSYYDRQPQGRTVTRMTHDIEDIEEFFGNTGARVIGAFVLILAAIVAMFATNVWLASIVFVGMVPALVVTLKTRGRSRVLHRDMASRNSAINARLSEFINGMPVIRGFGLEDWSRKEFRNRVGEYLASCKDTNAYYSILRPTADGMTLIPLIVLLSFGAPSVMAGTLSLATFVAFIRYCLRFSRPVMDLSREIHQVQRSFALLERVTQFLRAETEEIALGENGTKAADHLKGRVAFKDVEMSYDGENFALKNINLTCEPGDVVGLLGETGSGKTTTVSLLARLYNFQKGAIEIDDVPIAEYERGSLRKQIGFVSQDVVIFRGSVRENLGAGLTLTDEQVMEAAKATGLMGALERAHMTLDDELLDGGANISVGERQLIAITRVLLEAPRFLILDEATANIDPKLEETIHSAVDQLMQGRTCFIIAHRLETLENCSYLLVFRKGQIVAQGQHDRLVKDSPYYRELLEKGLSIELGEKRKAV